MIVLNNESLDKYTSIRVGGRASQMYIPESTDEMVRLSAEIDDLHIIGGAATY